MSARTKGLVLGKFAPLHKGHQLLIETALKQVDELLVMIYDTPELPEAPPLSVRAKWIRQIYPSARVIEAWNGPTEIGYAPEIKKRHEDYILATINGEKITHFFASEPYIEHMSRALGAKGIMVDQNRLAVPISATKIRADTFGNRDYLHPLVYRDLITNIVFLGGPSTGKSTLAEALSKEYHTNFMHEYGREYWNQHQSNRRLTKKQLLEIAKGHILRENNLLETSNRYLFTDTNAITTYLFSLNYHGGAHPKLQDLARQCSARYDLVFVCETDIPYETTWDRSGDANRQEMQRRTISYLNEHKIPYFMVKGTLDKRVKYVKSVLKSHKKYHNLTELPVFGKESGYQQCV